MDSQGRGDEVGRGFVCGIGSTEVLLMKNHLNPAIGTHVHVALRVQPNLGEGRCSST